MTQLRVVDHKTVGFIDKVALDFTNVFTAYKDKIKKELQNLDFKSGFVRQEDQVEDFVQAFFVKVWDKKILQSFDGKLSKSDDPILTFLKYHLRAFYKSVKAKELRSDRSSGYVNDVNYVAELQYLPEWEKYKQKHPEGEKFKTTEDFKAWILSRNDEVKYVEPSFEEDKGFCYEIRKISRAFKKSLKGEEIRAWKPFLYFEFSPREVAKQLGVSLRTAFNLRASIYSKAKKHLGGSLEGYYAGHYKVK